MIRPIIMLTGVLLLSASSLWFWYSQRRLPNFLTAGAAFTALAVAAGWERAIPLSSLGGLGAGLLLLLPLYLLGLVGAGDAKLLAAFGAWLGLQTTLLAAACLAVLALCTALILMAVRRSAGQVADRLAALLQMTRFGILSLRWLREEPGRRTVPMTLLVVLSAVVSMLPGLFTAL